MLEWNACEVCSRRIDNFSLSSSFSRWAISASGPESTVNLGAFRAAIEIFSFTKPLIFSIGLITASIEPRGISHTICPRRAIIIKASSRLITPASVAATYSPTLCPIIAAGFTPQEVHNSASAYPTVNSAG